MKKILLVLVLVTIITNNVYAEVHFNNKRIWNNDEDEHHIKSCFNAIGKGKLIGTGHGKDVLYYYDNQIIIITLINNDYVDCKIFSKFFTYKNNIKTEGVLRDGIKFFPDNKLYKNLKKTCFKTIDKGNAININQDNLTKHNKDNRLIYYYDGHIVTISLGTYGGLFECNILTEQSFFKNHNF